MEKFIIHYIEEFWNPRLDNPHSEKRYVGFNEDGKSLDVDVQCNHRMIIVHMIQQVCMFNSSSNLRCFIAARNLVEGSLTVDGVV
ncbi:hypothetical protein L6452_03045 [Arctium lappa]|uniref:Uncharacterized protein n=1 Tax=Arctium lappa TaxID=4217 RepID=A0ACB9FL93_ARCLA|nr:hypothetical protein L6452_03045 [Arctium lappa]